MHILPRLSALAFLAGSLAAAPARAADDTLIPFVMPWDDSSPGVTNAAAWNHRPAGAKGFVQTCGSHLCAGGERIRFLGVNIVFGSVAPEPGVADRLAARLARFGINIVRFHHMDSSPAPNGLLQKDGRTLDQNMLDRLDYFVAALKREGIYTDLNLHVGRKYPGFADWGESTPKYWKGVDNFHPGMIAMQRDYARALLEHRNPYTGTRYADEPALALIEINNENGLLHAWRNGELDNISGPYRSELENRWQAWLRARYRDDAALRSAWGVREVAAGPELLEAGLSTGSGNAGWSPQFVGDARASLTRLDDGTLRLEMRTPGKENWHIQLHHNRLAFEAGTPYTLRLRARADRPHRLGLQAMQAHAPWASLWQQQVTIDQNWRDYSFTFAPETGEETARLTLGRLGLERGWIELRDASLSPGGQLGLRPGESLAAGSVAISTAADRMNRTEAGQRDWLRFLWETESAYWRDFRDYLRQALGAHSLIVGTQVSYSPAPIQAQLDVVDGHAYWQHPHFPNKPWDIDDWYIADSPMSGIEGGGTLADLALRRVPGKPFIVTEYNHPAPNRFQAEALPLAAAWGALQDWDGIFLYSYGAHDRRWDSGAIDRFFDSHANPVKMASLLAASALFRRQDVTAGPLPATPQPADASWIEKLRTTAAMPSAEQFGALRNETLLHPVSLATTARSAPLALPLRSDSGELEWGRQGVRWPLARVDTPRSKLLAGGASGEEQDLGGVGLELLEARQDWGVISLTAMDGTGFAAPGHVLLCALGQVANTGQRWLDGGRPTLGRNFGLAPTLIEGIRARVRLPVPAAHVRAWALDERGQRQAPLPVSGGRRATIETGARWRTLWYEIEILPQRP